MKVSLVPLREVEGEAFGMSTVSSSSTSYHGHSTLEIDRRMRVNPVYEQLPATICKYHKLAGAAGGCAT